MTLPYLFTFSDFHNKYILFHLKQYKEVSVVMVDSFAVCISVNIVFLFYTILILGYRTTHSISYLIITLYYKKMSILLLFNIVYTIMIIIFSSLPLLLVSYRLILLLNNLIYFTTKTFKNSILYNSLQQLPALLAFSTF